MFQVPVGRSDAPAWATINDYSTPLTKPSSSWRSGSRNGASLSCAASPRVLRHTGHSVASLHAASHSRGWGGADLTPSRGRPMGSTHTHYAPPPPPPPYQHYQYSTVAQAAPGEASPYSVSSELYKHVLPGYFQFNTSNSRGSGSVLV